MPLVPALKSSPDFDRVFKNGKRYRSRIGQMIVLLSAKSNKIGIIVNKKFGGAVLRNRAKRIIKHTYRTFFSSLIFPIEIVFIPIGEILKMSADERKEDILSVLVKAGAIKK